MSARSRAETAALRLLGTLGPIQIPIPVDDIARNLGVRLTYELLAPDVSGMLYRDGDLSVIGVNAAHPRTRQRFTVAHEIGHFVLHNVVAHVDRSIKLDFRNERSGLAVDKGEIEANAFAAELLMPRQAFTQAILERAAKASKTEGEFVRTLAQTFDVSRQAMEHRLVNLNVLTPR